jgi:pimeloyl-ACP methyl ester carboxylesterase
MRATMRRTTTCLAGALLLLTLAALPARAAQALTPCRLRGVEHEALCGVVQRALDPARADSPRIDVHFALLPALARNKLPDPVFFFAGGPGQSAIDVAPNVSAMLGRFTNRRDIVLIDQRGVGKSAPLACEADDLARPLAEQFDLQRMQARQAQCFEQLGKLAHGDFRFYTTTLAMADADAVRDVLGADKINLVGGSYGTRAALEYMRQFPQRVRRAVLDGVAPPDMALPASFSTDNQAALDALFEGCAADSGCNARAPQLRERWRELLASLPRAETLAHPLTGKSESFELTRDALLGMVRGPLYAPLLAGALPAAIDQAARGRFEPLAALALSFGKQRGTRIAEGMHFAVVCSEDFPRINRAADKPGADFGGAFASLYAHTCARIARGTVPEAFYSMPAAPAATLLLSGGIDPATPPRHGERVATALGAKARHVVVANAGHGVMGIGCMRDVLYRFIDAASDDEALKVDASCVSAIPRPPMFAPPSP